MPTYSRLSGRIPEYWSVNPQQKRVTVLRLRAGKYLVYGRFGPGQVATSAKWSGLAVSVSDLFAAARR